MAKNEKVRLSPEIQQADENTFLALKAIAGYSPANPAYSLATVTARYDAMRAAAEVELRAQNALDAARDAAIAAQWEHHNLILGVKDQVIAQFGPDSDEVASLGLKKKSERKTPARSSQDFEVDRRVPGNGGGNDQSATSPAAATPIAARRLHWRCAWQAKRPRP
jgi:hypothetical protein